MNKSCHTPVTWASNSRAAQFFRFQWSSTRTANFMAIRRVVLLRVPYHKELWRPQTAFAAYLMPDFPSGIYKVELCVSVQTPGSPEGLQVLPQRGSCVPAAHMGCVKPQPHSLRQRPSWQSWCPAVSASALCGNRLPSPTAACFHLPLLRGSGKLSWIIFSHDGGI